MAIYTQPLVHHLPLFVNHEELDPKLNRIALESTQVLQSGGRYFFSEMVVPRFNFTTLTDKV